MNKKSKTLVFFGNEQLATGIDSIGAPSFEALIEAGYKIAFLVLNQQSQHGRNKRDPEIESIARKHNVTVLKPSSLSEIKQDIVDSGASFAVLASFGRIVSQEIIDLFEIGIINIHPSKLPHYRGTTPVETAILDGLESTSVSLMKLVKDMDAGAVYAQKEIMIESRESKISLASRLANAGSELLIENLEDIISGDNNGKEQNGTNATFTTMISKEDGLVDWSKDAEQIEREVRAYFGWPGSRCKVAGRDILLRDVSVVEQSGAPGEAFKNDKKLFVYCGTNALQINSLKPAGKNEMSGQAFLAGNPLS